MQLPSEKLTAEAVRWMVISGTCLCTIATIIEVLRTDCGPQIAANIQAFLCTKPVFNIAQGIALMTLVLGSALIGGGISQAISGRRSKELLHDVSDVLKSTFAQPALFSRGDKVSRYARRYHSYHMTRRNKKLIWRLTIYDFTKQPAVNKLLCRPIGVSDRETRASAAECEAFARGAHLIFCVAPNDDEPKFMRIYPTAGFGFHEIMWGISTHMDFERGRGLYKCLLSETPLHGVGSVGDITDPVKIQLLNEEWDLHFGDWRIDLRSSNTSRDDA